MQPNPACRLGTVLIGEDGGFKAPPGKSDAWGLVGHSLGEVRELLRRGQIGPEADQRSERVNIDSDGAKGGGACSDGLMNDAGLGRQKSWAPCQNPAHCENLVPRRKMALGR